MSEPVTVMTVPAKWVPLNVSRSSQVAKPQTTAQPDKSWAGLRYCAVDRLSSNILHVVTLIDSSEKAEWMHEYTGGVIQNEAG
jgi:hypothetical protein